MSNHHPICFECGATLRNSPCCGRARVLQERIRKLEEAVRVLARGIASVPELITEEIDANPIAKAAIAVAKARG